MNRIWILVIAAAALFSACNSVADVNADVAVEKAPVTADASLTMEVDGMMCSMGCVKTIQDGLNAAPGIANCVVDFENKTAVVTFDSKQTDQQAILSELESLHDGIYSGEVIQVDLPELPDEMEENSVDQVEV